MVGWNPMWSQEPCRPNMLSGLWGFFEMVYLVGKIKAYKIVQDWRWVKFLNWGPRWRLLVSIGPKSTRECSPSSVTWKYVTKDIAQITPLTNTDAFSIKTSHHDNDSRSVAPSGV